MLAAPVAVARHVVATRTVRAGLGADRLEHRLGVAEVPARRLILLLAGGVLVGAPVVVLGGAAVAGLGAGGPAVGGVAGDPAADELAIRAREVGLALGRIVVVHGFRHGRAADGEEDEEDEEASQLHVCSPYAGWADHMVGSH